jgi:hypothetical protein
VRSRSQSRTALPKGRPTYPGAWLGAGAGAARGRRALTNAVGSLTDSIKPQNRFRGVPGPGHSLITPRRGLRWWAAQAHWAAGQAQSAAIRVTSWSRLWRTIIQSVPRGATPRTQVRPRRGQRGCWAVRGCPARAGAGHTACGSSVPSPASAAFRLNGALVWANRLGIRKKVPKRVLCGCVGPTPCGAIGCGMRPPGLGAPVDATSKRWALLAKKRNFGFRRSILLNWRHGGTTAKPQGKPSAFCLAGRVIARSAQGQGGRYCLAVKPEALMAGAHSSESAL